MLSDFKVEPQPDQPRVLLVEDDAVLRELVADAMRDAGLGVVEAASADQAQRYLREGQADLIFSDVEMPGSMSGLELGRWLRRTHPEIALILTSGAAAPGASELGHFIQKPYKILAAIETVRALVDAQRNAGG